MRFPLLASLRLLVVFLFLLFLPCTTTVAQEAQPAEPPALHPATVLPLPDYSRAGALKLSIAASGGAAASFPYYAVRTRQRGETDWLQLADDLREGNGTVPMTFAQAGAVYEFEAIGIDQTRSNIDWPSQFTAQATTTLYWWQYESRVSDERGVPLAGWQPAVSPSPVASIASGADGVYRLLLGHDIPYQIDGVTHTVTGDISATSVHYGSGTIVLTDSVTLGGTCVGLCLEQLLGTGAPRIPEGLRSFQAQYGADGSLYLAGILVTQTSTGTILYWHRTPEGLWEPRQDVIQGQIGTNYLKMAVDSTGIVHLVWKQGSYPDASLGGVYYTQRSRSGQWSAAERIPGDLPVFLQVDKYDALHAALQCSGLLCVNGFDSGSAALLSLRRPADGSWEPPELLYGTTPMSYESFTFHLEPDGGLRFASIEDWVVSNLIYERQQAPGGHWSDRHLLLVPPPYISPSYLSYDAAGRIHAVYMYSPPVDNWSMLQGRDAAEPAPIYAGTSYYPPLLSAADTGSTELLIGTAPTRRGGYRFRQEGSLWSAELPLLANDHAFNSITAYAQAPDGDRFLALSDGTFWGVPRCSDTSVDTWHITFVVPPATNNPTLSFRYDAVGLDNPADSAPLLTVHIDDQSAGGMPSVQQTPPVLSVTHGATNKLEWVDLTPWASQTVTVTFAAENPAGSMHHAVTVHNISLSAWTTPVVSTIAPTKVPAGETTILRLTGDNLAATTGVWLGSIHLPLSVANTATLLVTAPSSIQPGIYRLRVRGSNGNETIATASIVVGHILFLPTVQR